MCVASIRVSYCLRFFCKEMKFPFIGIGKQTLDCSPGREILLILLLMIFIEHLLCAKHCVDCWEFGTSKMTFLPLPSLGMR